VVVAVGDNGAIYSSADGIAWAKRGSFTPWLRSVGYGAGLFVCVGEGGFVATSSDGVAWTKKTVSTTADLNKVAYVNDRFWIVGENGTVLTNNFRVSFLSVNLGLTNSLYAVAGNSNEVVIAGDSVVMLGDLAKGTWTEQADASSPTLAPLWPYYSALWDGRLFLLGGRAGMQVQGYRTNSTDPLSWYTDSQATRSWLWSATRATNFYAAVGADGTIVTSLDGIEWDREAVPAGVESQVLLGIAGNDQALVTVGSAGTILRSPNILTNAVSTNDDGQLVTNQVNLMGLVWEQINSPTANDLQAIAATPAQFIAGGANGTILSSGDGITWQHRSSGVSAYLSGAAAWPGGFVMTGSAGTILSSANGLLWSVKSSGTAEWVYAVRYAGAKLIAVGENGLILTSDDGSKWQARSSGTTEWINDVTFAQGHWYAVAGSGTVLSSADAVTWAPLAVPTSRSLYGVVSDGQQLITAGLEGMILRTQLVPFTTPVNFLSYGQEDGISVFLFGGQTDQRFALETKARLSEPWTLLDTLELVEDGGTLIYQRPTGNSPARFFRTRLLP
jgi:hypothetical protein